MSQLYSDYKKRINEYLTAHLPKEQPQYPQLAKAIEYSILNGGKKIRPVLTLEACRLCGGDEGIALPFACAVETIHAYSLVHDDLPCMDNDDLRRGLPSTHKKFGEDIALLAGDALQSLAFSMILSDEALKKTDPLLTIKAAALLSDACGTDGMVGGQVLDLTSEGKELTIEELEFMHSKKTGALILCAVQMGGMIAGATDEQITALEEYAKAIGLAFQVVDDILDVTSSEERLGKPIGSDESNKKSTYVSLLGLDEATRVVNRLTKKAIKSIKIFGEEAEFFVQLAKDLSIREI